MIGTATSGQAAKTLGDAAHVDSRTTASLLWRLQHGRERLDSSTVLIIDEAGMVDDPAMLALLTATELHGSKVIVVGDHHQLSAVGPGGGLEALTTRHPDAVHHLDDNIRQRDPVERAALEELRSGNVARAVAFYAAHGRIDRHDDRWDALLATTAAWHDDLEAGHDTIMLAWRRADVAQLNHFARLHRRGAGHLGDTSVDAAGGRRYAVGDHVVALAADADRRFVTSQRGLVTAIDKTTGTITIDFNNGQQTVTLSGEAIDAHHLDHAYATTVHRAQGATVDRAHVYADGGGRELTYVALSRARRSTTVHCVADALDQAVDDLERETGRLIVGNAGPSTPTSPPAPVNPSGPLCCPVLRPGSVSADSAPNAPPSTQPCPPNPTSSVSTVSDRTSATTSTNSAPAPAATPTPSPAKPPRAASPPSTRSNGRYTMPNVESSAGGNAGRRTASWISAGSKSIEPERSGARPAGRSNKI